MSASGWEARPQARAGSLRGPPRSPAVSATVGRPETSCVTTRVLLVDSRPIVLHGFTTLLDQHRPRLQVAGQAASYASGLALARQLWPDVILLSAFWDDIALPDAVASMQRYGRVVLFKGLHDPLPALGALGTGVAGVLIAEQSQETIVRTLLAAGSPRRYGTVPLQPDDPGAGQRHSRTAQLTERECELVRVLLAHPGAKYLVIAGQLGISEHTVHNHLSSIYHKLNVVNRNDLLVRVVRNGLWADPQDPQTRHE